MTPKLLLGVQVLGMSKSLSKDFARTQGRPAATTEQPSKWSLFSRRGQDQLRPNRDDDVCCDETSTTPNLHLLDVRNVRAHYLGTPPKYITSRGDGVLKLVS